MKTYNIQNKKFYKGDDIKTKYPKLFTGLKNIREFVKQNNISNKFHLFAKFNDKKWVKSSGKSYKFDKVFLLKSWMDKKYLNDKAELYVDNTQDAPEIIELEDNEKFIDGDGNVLEIEVRGERECDKCYFKVKDVMDEFDMPKLHDTLKDKRNSGYMKNIHYEYFYVPAITGNKKIKKLFLTYTGLLRVLFVSRNEKTNKFVDWATKTLFTAQMGTPEQKKELASNMIGITPQTIKTVFDKTTKQMPCIYLFSIGQVSDLRETLEISDDYDDLDFVYKWGMTIDLKRRTKEHEKTFSKKEGFDLQLVLFNNIDPQYISEAETTLKHAIIGMRLKLKHHTHKELAIIPKREMKLVRENFDLIASKYAGHYADVVHQLKLLETKHERDLLIAKNENELLKKDIELLKKDIEILKMKKSKSKN